MKKKILIGLGLGIVAGIFDLTPMIVQELPWSANISAFSMWLIAGFLIATSALKINSIVKGILISFLGLIPCAVIIAWDEPNPLGAIIPIALITLLLGSALGYAIEHFTKEKGKE